MWQKPSKTRSQSEGLFRAAAFEKSCPVEPTLQDFPGEGVGLGKGQNGGWVQEGEQILHKLGSHPEQPLCLSVGHGSQYLSLYEALNIKLCPFTQRQTNAEHFVVIHSEKKRIWSYFDRYGWPLGLEQNLSWNCVFGIHWSKGKGIDWKLESESCQTQS